MKILVVDDTKNIRALLTTCLEMEGHEAKISPDGMTALKMLSGEAFDLVFLDIKMPEISGTEVLRRMRGMGIKTPVIIITAYATVKNAIDCTQLGAVAYLQKPFTAEKVKNVLAGIMETCGAKSPKKTAVDSAKAAIEAGNLLDALGILKRALADESPEPKVLRLLSQVCGNLGNSADADKFDKMYKALL